MNFFRVKSPPTSLLGAAKSTQKKVKVKIRYIGMRTGRSAGREKRDSAAKQMLVLSSFFTFATKGSRWGLFTNSVFLSTIQIKPINKCLEH